MVAERDIDHEQKWYFGGVAATAASLFTYPFEVIKVPMQIRRTEISLPQMTKKIFRTHGIRGLYNGITSTLIRHCTYSFVRFGLYDIGKAHINSVPMSGKITIAAFAGGVAGFASTPSFKINVRMNNDLILPKHKRRNYKNYLDGIYQIYKTEGIRGLFVGGLASTVRGAVMAISQMALYDELATVLIREGRDHNNVLTHFEASLISGIASSIITEPLNVIRSRLMEAEGKPSGGRGLIDIIKHTAKFGHYNFYKGFVPAFMHIVPHTILTFMFMEQLRINFGKKIVVETDEKPSSLRKIDD